MRMQIELDDELVAQIDELSGPRGRSAFVRSAVPSQIMITTGMPIRQLRCESSAVPKFIATGDRCFPFSTPPCSSTSSETTSGWTRHCATHER
jgi:hypothetical protein